MFSGLFATDLQLIVHAYDAGQTRHGVLGQGYMGGFGDCSGQGDNTVFGYSRDGIVLEAGFEHIRLSGG